jgi:aspartyl/asparaginyl beta-hydroxylase (cupin superfamily)
VNQPTARPADDAVVGLVHSARAASAAGRETEATQLLDRAVKMAPRHPFVNNELGVRAQQRGDAESAATHFGIATTSDPRHPALWSNLSQALHELGRFDEERDAIERALQLEPRHLSALLQKGVLLEATTGLRSAVSAYQNALATIPEGVTLPPQVKEAVDHARAAVSEGQADLMRLIEERLAPVYASTSAIDRRRADKCIDILTGRRRAYVPEPTFMHFPGLPIIEFFDREQTPWLGELEAATDDIRSELLGVLAADREGLEPYVAYPDGTPLDQWKELNRSRRWSAYFLWNQGEPQHEHLARCPATAAALERTPQCRVLARAPTAFFSILDANTHIPAHTGITNTRLTVHLPLIVPPGCRFRVGSETRDWVAGEAWVFDDSINHEAWNDSDSSRAILLFDIWNPLLTPLEQEMARIATEAYGEYHYGSGLSERS